MRGPDAKCAARKARAGSNSSDPGIELEAFNKLCHRAKVEEKKVGCWGNPCCQSSLRAACHERIPLIPRSMMKRLVRHCISRVLSCCGIRLQRPSRCLLLAALCLQRRSKPWGDIVNPAELLDAARAAAMGARAGVLKLMLGPARNPGIPESGALKGAHDTFELHGARLGNAACSRAET